MNIPILLILCSVSVSAFAQYFLKRGMTDITLKSPDYATEWVQTLGAIIVNPFIITGFALYGLGAILWLWVLARLDLSAAYPFVGLSFVITMLIGSFFLGEAIGTERLIGTFLVVAGCMLIASGA